MNIQTQLLLDVNHAEIFLASTNIFRERELIKYYPITAMLLNEHIDIMLRRYKGKHITLCGGVNNGVKGVIELVFESLDSRTITFKIKHGEYAQSFCKKMDFIINDDQP